MKIRPTQILCLAIGLLLCGAMLSEILLYSQNTLLNNKNWIATKRALVMPVMGSDAFLITRMPMAGNSLDLGAWHGYQEVLLKNPKDLREIEFKFEIPEGSYLDIILDKTGGSFHGIRLSRSEVYPHAFFQSDPNGHFTHYQPLPARAIPPGWHIAALLFRENEISLRIDREQPIMIESRIRGAGGLGFRGGLAGAKIDDIIAKDVTGAIFKESFRNGNNWLKLTVQHSILLAVFFGAAFLLLWIGAGWRPSQTIAGSIIIAFQIFLCSSIYYAFDFFYWSKKPFQTQMRLLSTYGPVPQMPFEQYRFYFFDSWYRAIEGNRNLWQELSSDYPLDRIYHKLVFCPSSGDQCQASPLGSAIRKKKNCLRFVLVGTSQSVGAGASSLEQTFFARIHRGLRQTFTNKCVESLNLSVSGSNLAELTDIFQKYAAFRPDLVIVNLSNNDPEGGFYSGLRRFAKISRKIHAKVLFVAEANSADSGHLSLLKKKHEIMRQAGKELGIETFPMQEFLAADSIRRSGQIWWDFVHLSSYGQSLVADWLLPKASALLKKR